MSKTKIEDLPSLDELDPEDQRLIANTSPPKKRKRTRRQRRPVATTPDHPGLEDDVIVSRIPPGS